MAKRNPMKKEIIKKEIVEILTKNFSAPLLKKLWGNYGIEEEHFIRNLEQDSADQLLQLHKEAVREVVEKYYRKAIKIAYKYGNNYSEELMGMDLEEIKKEILKEL